MRPVLFIEALVALAIGAGIGTGFLFASGELKTPGRVNELRAELAATQQQIAAREESIRLAEKARVEAEERAERERAEAEELARRAAALAAEQARLAVEQARTKEPPPPSQRASFGTLTVKSTSPLAASFDGANKRGKGLDFAFFKKPETLTIQGGSFTIRLSPTVQNGRLLVDVRVSPMSIVSAQGERIGTSAHGLEVGRTPFALDFNSPTAGDLNLVLLYKN